jgi:hypothetical protein
MEADTWVALVRRRWPAGVCSDNGGTHGWVRGAASVFCVYCGDCVIREEIAEYRRWTEYVRLWGRAGELN